MIVTRAFSRTPRLAFAASSFLAGSTTFALSLSSLKATPASTQSEGRQIAESQQLIVPTLQALVRASRLVKTAVLIASDYKRAEWGLLPLPSSEGEHTNTQEESFWREESNRLEKALSHAQAKYTEPEGSDVQDLVERVKRKKAEKQQMNQIAEALADAEQKVIASGCTQSDVHRKAANRLLELCRLNRGVYIKIGQHLANLDYVIPQEYIHCLSALFDDTPQTPFALAREIIRQDLKADPDELFTSIDPVPIASASLAQVHVAYEKGTGRKLAVKIQHAGLRETSAGDIFALTTVVRACERIVDGFTWGWIADEIAPQLPKELDFIHEGRNSEEASRHLRNSRLDCVIPSVLWQFTSPRVLTMEFEEGFKATDVDAIDAAGMDRAEVARLISSVFSSQAFIAGHVHCDPHPANVLLRKNKKGKPQMVLVDHGLYRRLDDDFRLKYAWLWRSLMLADLDGIKSSCNDLGVGKAYTLFAAMLTARPYDEMIERSKTGSLAATDRVGSKADQAIIRGYAQRFIGEIFKLLSAIPRQMLFLLKMNDCLRHIDFALGSPTNTVVVSGEFAARAVFESQMARKQSWLQRSQAWWAYANILFRIRIHNASIWLYDTWRLKRLQVV